MEENLNNENDNETKPENKTKIFFYISVALCVLTAVAFGLTFTALGLYALISSILLGIGSLSFAATQKKKYDFPAVKYVKIAAYVLLAVCVAFFIGGLIYSSLV
ncbi:MAG: hypothetical protein K2L42_00275 [Clostridia bacterium]|nr:hypothetical protein [Clostridia bacterium]